MSSFTEHVQAHCDGITEHSSPYDKLYAIYVRALADQSPVHLIPAFITDCFGATNWTYGPDYQLNFDGFIEQVLDDSQLTLFFMLADELTDDQ